MGQGERRKIRKSTFHLSLTYCSLHLGGGTSLHSQMVKPLLLPSGRSLREFETGAELWRRESKGGRGCWSWKGKVLTGGLVPILCFVGPFLFSYHCLATSLLGFLASSLLPCIGICRLHCYLIHLLLLSYLLLFDSFLLSPITARGPWKQGLFLCISQSVGTCFLFLSKYILMLTSILRGNRQDTIVKGKKKLKSMYKE